MVHEGFCITSVEGLGVTLGRGELLRGVTFTLNCGQLTAVIGRNGAGKTTLLRALLGEIPHTGKVKFTRHDGTQGPLSMGYVPQRAPLDPSSPTSVYDLCAASVSRFPAFLPRRDRTRVSDMLAAFGAEELINRRLCELSGGEWQRVMLAVATSPVPELLILDEPQTGIDASGLRLFYEKIDELKKTRDLAVLMVSHDFGFLSEYADHVLLLSRTVRARGSPGEVFSSEEFKELFGGVGNIRP
ncbi:MAG: metal ABC transporter ATP-binding protein [Oscillospiraceae bacterium]|nr:metal ABC transporter ATP-binding protein [Oscillospiraceae bacterium]